MSCVTVKSIQRERERERERDGECKDKAYKSRLQEAPYKCLRSLGTVEGLRRRVRKAIWSTKGEEQVTTEKIAERRQSVVLLQKQADAKAAGVFAWLAITRLAVDQRKWPDNSQLNRFQ
jgi:hypothetical protein